MILRYSLYMVALLLLNTPMIPEIQTPKEQRNFGVNMPYPINNGFTRIHADERMRSRRREDARHVPMPTSFPKAESGENEFKKSFRDRTFKNGFMSLNAKEQTIFQNKPFNKMLDKSGQSINVAAYGAFLDKAIAESNAALAAKSGSWMKKNLPSLESAKNALPQIKGPKSYLKAVRSDLEDTEKGSKTSLLGKLGRGTVKNRLPGNAYIIRKVVTDHLAKSRPAKGSSSRKDTTIGFRDLFSADNIPSLSEESQSKSKSKSKSRSRSRSKASASESDPLSSSEEAMLSESVEESIAKGEVVGVLDEDQIAVLRVTADNFKDSLDQVQESLSETKELYANMKAQLSSMGLQILPNPSHVRPLSRVGSDRYFPSSYRPRLLSQLNPRGAVKLKVPLRMKATPRRAAEELYVYPKRKSFPIGDLYHARMAIIYVLSSDHSRQRKKVIKTVQANWPDYSWSTFWNAKRKGKKLKTWNQYLK